MYRGLKHVVQGDLLYTEVPCTYACIIKLIYLLISLILLLFLPYTVIVFLSSSSLMCLHV